MRRRGFYLHATEVPVGFDARKRKEIRVDTSPFTGQTRPELPGSRAPMSPTLTWRDLRKRHKTDGSRVVHTSLLPSNTFEKVFD